MMWRLTTFLVLVLTLSACARGTYEAYDADRNSYLTEEEVSTGLFDTWDVDNDMMLTDDEFGTGLAEFGAFPGDADFGVWDEDNDSFIDENEFGVGFDEAGVFDEWDLDRNNILGVDEYAEIGLP